MSRPAGALIAIPIAVAFLLGTVGSVMFGFGVGTACTTSREPSACGSVDAGVWLNIGGQLALAVGLGVTAIRQAWRRRSSAPVGVVLAALAFSVSLFIACILIAGSWSWA